MKYTVAVAALASGVAAYAANNVTVVTEVVSEYTTYCPGPTEITHGGSTYTVTEATTLTITDCPCTITKPVTTSTIEVCHTCTETPVVPPPAPTGNVTMPGTGYPVPPVPTSALPPSPEVPAGAGKVAFSGAALAGVVGLAAFLL